MDQDLDVILELGKEAMAQSLEHLQSELSKVRAGKASTAMLKGVMVNYYGSPTPLSQVANLNTPDSRTISIQPWEKSILGDIEKAIFEANLGVTPMNDGEFVRISVPPLTQDRRKDLVKQCKGMGEDTKVSLRNERHKLMDAIKKEVKNGYPEDAGKKKEEMVQNMTNDFGTKVDKLIAAKEADILTV
jgi:ribosome recycling factor